MRVNVSSTKSTMGHLIAAAGAVEVAVCALADPSRRDAGQREPASSATPTATSTSSPARRAAQRVRVAMSNSFGFGGSNSCVVVRHPDGSRRRRRGASAEARHDGSRRAWSSPAPAPSARPAWRRTTILDAVLRRPLGDRPDRAVGHDGLAAAASRRRSPTSIRARWSTTASCTSSSAAPTSFGLYAAGRAIERSGIVAHRDALDGRRRGRSTATAPASTSARAAATTRTSTTTSRCSTAAGGELPAFGRELANTVNPMWLLRTLPNNVLGHIGIKHGLKGAERLHHQPQRRRHARGHRGDRGAAQRRGRPRGRGRATIRRSSRRWCSTTTGWACSRRETLRPFDARHDGSLFGEGAGALVLETEASARGARTRRCSAKCSAAATPARRRACSRSATTATASRARSREALDDAQLAPADVGMIVAHGNGTPQSDASEAAAIRRVFGAAMPPVTGVQVGVRPH